MKDYRKYTKRRLNDKYKDYSYKPKRKILSGFFGYVFYSIISAVIFLLIYSYFFAPGTITNLYNEATDKVEDLGDTISDKIPSNSNQNSITGNVVLEKENPSGKCLQQINKQLEIDKEKSALKLTTKIIEHEYFDNTQDALDYLDEWGYLSYPSINSYKFPIFYNQSNFDYEIINYDNIEIVLVRRDVSYGGDKVGDLTPTICINEKVVKL